MMPLKVFNRFFIWVLSMTFAVIGKSQDSLIHYEPAGQGHVFITKNWKFVKDSSTSVIACQVWVSVGRFLKKTDTSHWVSPPIIDSGRIMQELLDLLKRDLEAAIDEQKYTDSCRKAADLRASRWATMCKWLCDDYGITRADFIGLCRRRNWLPANIQPPRQKRQKL